MPRNRKRKTDIGLHTAEEMRNALRLVNDGQKIRAVARQMNIPFTTLYRYHKKIQKALSEGKNVDSVSLIPNYAVRKLFTEAQEKELVNYMVKCSVMFYGLTMKDARKLGYEMAQLNNIQVPQKWHDTQEAGIEWLYNFRKRHPMLSLRTPEGCSLSRATSFNRHNVELFFDNLQDVMSRHEAFGNGTRVFNLDETNTMTVQKPGKVLAVKGQKQVSKVISAERGTLVTTCYIISALGNTLPPVMIFPRVHFKPHMINEAPTGTLGLATQSGWMNAELFVKTMQHFIIHSNSSKDNPSLLILDNHESHICLEALNLAKDNGVTILTFPPHTTGKLQPLDVGVFGPFKTAYNRAVDSWMMRNPGKTFSIYEVAGCVKEAHMRAMTPSNICNAFKATGIFPFNRAVFSDADFSSSEVTDRYQNKENETNPVEGRAKHTPSPSFLFLDADTFCDSVPKLPNDSPNENLATKRSNSVPESPMESSFVELPVTPVKQKIIRQPDFSSNQILSAIPSSSTPSASSNSAALVEKIISPFQFRGLPKAGPRKGVKAARRRGKSMIATDTPNKLEIEKRSEENKRKKSVKSTKYKKRKILESDSNDEEEDLMSLYSEEEPSEEEKDIEILDPNKFQPLTDLPKEGDFILVEFKVNGKKIYYIAKVIGEKNEELEVSFLRKSVKNTNNFHMPNVPDVATVVLTDVKMILPQPGLSGNTKRTQGLYHFDIDFTEIDLR